MAIPRSPELRYAARRLQPIATVVALSCFAWGASGAAKDASGRSESVEFSSAVGSGAAEEPIFQVPVPPEPPRRGWTNFAKSPDTRLVYVSSSQGVDTNDGLTPERPLRTLERAVSQLRTSYPDWLLLKRGDVFRGKKIAWHWSGRSETEKLLVSTYGDGPRPVLEHISIVYEPKRKRASRTLQHVAFVGLDFYAPALDPASTSFDPGHGAAQAFRLRGRVRDLLVEDCRMRFVSSSIQNRDEEGASGITLRRSIFVDNYHPGGRSQGWFIKRARNVLIEENLFDHNGWNAGLPVAQATIYNHNMYLTENENVVVRDNILARASNFAIKIRGDRKHAARNHLVEGNLIVGPANALETGSGHKTDDPYPCLDTTIRGNVFTRVGHELKGKGVQCTGVRLEEADGAVVEDNLFVDKPECRHSFFVRLMPPRRQHPHRRVAVRNNVAHGWLTKRQFDIGEKDTAVQTVEGGNLVNLPASRYVDASRSIAAYDRKLGGEGSVEHFLSEARKQSRDTWRDPYTAHAIVRYFREGFSAR